MTSKRTNREKAVCDLLDTLLKAEKAPLHQPETKLELEPVWDKDLCARCALCYVYCPDAAISRQEDGYFSADTELCKGCGICHRECWFGAISMQEVD